MPITATNPIDAAPFLPGAQFSDAFSTITEDVLDARGAADKMFAQPPHWMKALMRLRDAIVAPLGLKTERTARTAVRRVGMFPIVSETPQRLVVGLDDVHQDFRAIVDVTPLGMRSRVTLTTIVKTHNWLGRTYLATIMPFHRLIVRSMLRKLA